MFTPTYSSGWRRRHRSAFNRNIFYTDPEPILIKHPSDPFVYLSHQLCV